MPVVSIAINDSFHAESSLYRLNRKTTLHIVPGASLLGRHVALYCNVPVTDNGEFIRQQYVHLNWFNRHGKKLTDEYHPHTEIKELDVYCEIEIKRAGSFHFYFTYDGSDSTTPQGSFYIQIEPNITVGADGSKQVIPLDAIRCQTVLSKCLGPLSTWESKLIVSKNSGYNMVHFTPVQELGASRSGYSIANQHRVNPEFSDTPKSNSKNKPGPTFDDLEKAIKRMRTNWGIASICDIVLNHTANESEWIHEHPEATYSCFTCPYLRPAFLLDAMLAQVTADTKAGLLETVGVPAIVETEDHLQALKYQLHTVYLPKVRLWEFYQVDVEKYFQKFSEKMQNSSPPTAHTRQASPTEITLFQDPEYRRLGCTIDFDAAYAKYNVFSPDVFDEDSRLRKCAAAFRNKLEQLNEVVRNEINDYLSYADENCLASIRYERVEPFGRKVKEISLQYPLLSVYFTDGGLKGIAPLTDIEPAMYTDKGKYFMAHNGWVMNADPLLDFAAMQPGRGNVYFKRELISWGDSIKLRFGEKPADSPYLWNYMKEYVATTAKIFDGVRLDNCHSTPLHVAEYLLDFARQVNPELYVVAELFTNSDQTDNIFVNRLGITSLIREAQSAWDSHEEGRLVYRYGGAPVGAFYNSVERPLAPTIAHALFLDLTHDNPSPIEKRSVFDLLPSAALVSMACCATGSTRGYDELVPHHIHVVNEERQYQEWNKGVDAKSGIIAAKRAINILHGNLVQEGLNQVYVDQMDVNVVAVTRHSPDNHQTVILVAHTSFQNPEPNAGPSNVKPLVFEGDLEEIIFEAELTHKFIKNGSDFEKYLALGSLQFVAVSPSTDLPKLSPKTSPPLPPSRCSTISAGLPHFSTGYMRTWGRDTFISLRGLLILTGRYDEARYHILGFGSCLRHGLMPNLLDNGTTPRFNCRDAIWWWMHSIKQYVSEVPNGHAILSESVSRIFPTDESENRKAGEVDQPLIDIMQEALTIHFQGLIFRERNAGKAIDEHMLDGGFNNQIGIHPSTGFVFGGNVLNCGTWMDKMGSSERAGNKGIPSTPRDGSAVELVGLQMAVLRFMDNLGKKKLIPYQSVERTGKNGAKTTWTYEHWANLIAENFETHFFVSKQCTDPLVNKRGIYKDSLGASKPWGDFQLRCNFPIAMVVAPELFDPNHAWQALELAKKHLVGPLGMKTLDPEDFEYRGFYDNSNDSDDPHVSHGSNYHQGPEWLWPIGFYLRARLIFAKATNRLPETVAETWSILTKHLHEIQSSPWRGLPELTNENGSYCVDSCPTQAWSMATILEVVKDLKQIDSGDY